jgi:regulator of nonsense transcripts 2
LINYDPLMSQECPAMKTLDNSKIDGFRVRLVCNMLDTLGGFFSKGERKTRMDRFLMFFQRYILTKNYVLMDLEFALLDMFDKLRPSVDFKKFHEIEDVRKACEKVEEFEREHF